jgi:predicted CXXCH cytochrome family protein
MSTTQTTTKISCTGCHYPTTSPQTVWLRDDGEPRQLCPNCKKALDTLPLWALGALIYNVMVGEVEF